MSNFYAKSSGGYERTSSNALHNAEVMRDVLGAWGWTLNAVCGLLGNVEIESGYNPWRWQGDNVLSSTSPNIDISSAHAYGFFQFDPAGKYIHSPTAQAYPEYAPNFSNRTGAASDGVSQLKFINGGHGGYYATSAYPLTLEQFKRSRNDPRYLARAWLMNYERPADPSATIATREAAAAYWFTKLGGGPIHGDLPVWLIAKITRQRRLKNVLS